MGAQARLSTKGQVVIPKDIRDALDLQAGEALLVTREGRRVVFEQREAKTERITYEEFRRRIPAYSGPKVDLADMRVKDDDIYRDHDRSGE